MAERFWEQSTPMFHTYIDDATGRIIGVLRQRRVDRVYEAHAYARNVGEYFSEATARVAVEVWCVTIEEEQRQLAAAQAARVAAQADGAAE